MFNRFFFQSFLFVSLLGLLTACGGFESSSKGDSTSGNSDNGDNQISTTYTIDAFYTKAPVDKADCTLYRVDKNGNKIAISQPKKSDKGVVSFTTNEKSAVVSLECEGGTYTDEASGDNVDLTGTKMRSVIKKGDDDDDEAITVTPLTEIAVRFAEADGDLEDIEEHAKEIADEFGLDGIDILKEKPKKLEDISSDNDNGDKYGVILSALSQSSQNKRKHIEEVIEDFEVDLHDGDLNEDDLDEALMDLTINEKTNQKINEIPADIFNDIGEDDNQSPAPLDGNYDNDICDGEDEFPLNPDECKDSDGDGVGDNADEFVDNPLEWKDSDKDGRGDNSDVFPSDASEQDDRDGDGVGDNADAFDDDPLRSYDRDQDGYAEEEDVDDNDETILGDSDGDSEHDGIDPDDDNDGRLDTEEDKNNNGIVDNGETDPKNPDSDGDGVKDNVDPDPLDQFISEIKTPDLKFIVSDGQILFGWDALLGAESYQLTIDDGSNNPEIILKQQNEALSHQFIATNGTQYTCSLIAIYPGAIESEADVEMIASGPRQLAFTAPFAFENDGNTSSNTLIQRVIDVNTGAPVNDLLKNPDGTNKPLSDIFTVQDGADENSLVDLFSNQEAYFDVEPLSHIPTTISAVLMMDMSSSIYESQYVEDIKQAAIDTIKLLESDQQIALYTFGVTNENGALTFEKIKDFSNDKLDLSLSISNYEPSPFFATNLYSATEEGLDNINNSFSLDEVNYGYVILITDGFSTETLNQQLIDLKKGKDLFVLFVGDLTVGNMTQGERDRYEELVRLVLGIDLVDDESNEILITENDISAAEKFIFPISDINLLSEKLIEINRNARSFSDGIYVMNMVSGTHEAGTRFSSIALKGSPSAVCDQDRIGQVDLICSTLTNGYSTGSQGKPLSLVALSNQKLIDPESPLILNAGEKHQIELLTRWGNLTAGFDWDIRNEDGGIIFNFDGSNKRLLNIEVPYSTQFSTATIHVTHELQNINNNFLYKDLETTIELIAGNGIFIEEANENGEIFLNSRNDQLTLNAQTIPDFGSNEYNWQIADNTIVETKSEFANQITLSRLQAGKTTLTLSNTVRNIEKTFDVYVSVGLSDVTAMDSNLKNDTCVIDNSTIICWGDSGFITEVPELNNPLAISVGNEHACAIDSSGVHCWGEDTNNSGKLNTPELINPYLIAVGNQHSCAVDDQGLQCWGDNLYVPTNDQENLTNISDLSIGVNHSCVVADQGVSCWGGALGGLPMPVLNNPSNVEVGFNNACAIDDRSVKCWGDNSFQKSTPPTNLLNPDTISVGRNHVCANDSNGVVCWGESIGITAESADILSSGNSFSCSVSDGELNCWGAGKRAIPQ